MNRLAWLAVGLVTFSALADVAVVRAQVGGAAGSGAAATALPAPPAIPAEAKTGNSPQTFRPQIQAFIQGHLARIKAADPKVAKGSRDALLAEVSGTSSSPTYKDLYAEILAQALSTLLSDPEPRVRLQAGVLAAKVATASQDNDRMAPVAIKLLGDKNPALVIWGMKTARGVLNYQARLAKVLSTSQVPAAVAKAVAANPGRAEIARDAYDALQLDPAKVQSFKDGQIATLAPHVSSILATRAAEYSKAFPEQADADRDATTFFSNYAFAGLPQDQKFQVVQNIADVVVLSAEQAVAVAGGPTQRATIEQAIITGKSLYVIAEDMNKAGPTPAKQKLVAAAQFFRDNGGAMQPPATQVLAAANATFAALKGIPEYKDLRMPALAPGAQPGQPATAPAP